jgi:arylsulfatase A-like enzyme
MSEAVPSSPREGLLTALVGSQFLLVASFANWFYQTGSGSEAGSAFQEMHEGPILGSALGSALAGFALALVAIHLAFGLACWLLARASRKAWPDYPASQRTWVVLWFMIGVLWVLVANAALYPRSTFGDHLFHFAQTTWAGVSVFQALTVAAAAAVLLPLAVLARRRLSAARGRGHGVPWLVSGALAMAVSGMAVVSHPLIGRGEPAAPSARPHVIFIGLDSLRCDATSVSGRAGLTPNVDAFVARSTAFTDTMTPLARTYPSWVSILTGKHPHTTGAIVNLIHKDQIDLGETLPLAFRRAGYRTSYAIDEVRFSNIDASYGFDQTITPPIGAADFLIGLINDTPLSNLVANTRLGQWLLPYGYANRGAAMLYDPDSFVERLDRELDFAEPTFLALHMTLAHWPYTWSDSRKADVGKQENWTAAHYRPAVQRLDRQFADVLQVLERKGALRNAIVVVLSDHGEAVGLPGDSPWAMTGPENDPYAFATITGHGTSVLSPHQYRVLLAMRGFGAAAAGLDSPATVAAPASLEDVAPTINDWLGLGMKERFDGRSLLPLLRGAPDAGAPLAGRVRFTETEFNPRGFLPHEKQTTSAIANAMRSYEIDRETGRMYMRRAKHPLLLRQRQYAALRGSEIVAAIPGTYSPEMRFIYIDQSRSGLPMRLEGRPDPATAPGAAALWTALHERFGDALHLARPGVPVPREGDAQRHFLTRTDAGCRQATAPLCRPAVKAQANQ